LTETETKHVDSAEMSRFYLKTETVVYETSFSNKSRKMDNVQEINNCINIPSSQTFRSYLRSCTFVTGGTQ
jgi:hypothetical protein